MAEHSIRSVRVKLAVPRGDSGLPARCALWATHAAVNDACAYYEQRLLLMRGNNYFTGDEETGKAEVAEELRQVIKDARTRNRASGDAADSAALDETAELLRRLYENIVPSAAGEKGGTAQDAGRFLGPLTDRESEGLTGVYEKLSRPAPNWISLVKAEDSSALGIANEWLETSSAKEWMSDTGSPARWVRLAREKNPDWPQAFVLKLEQLEKQTTEGAAPVVKRLRELGALPLFPPYLTPKIEDARGNLNPWDRLAFRLAVSHMLAWESWSRRAAEERQTRIERLQAFRDEHVQAAEHHIEKLRAYEAERKKHQETPEPGAPNYKIRRRAVRGWDDLKKKWRSAKDKSESKLHEIMAAEQTRQRGGFGDPALFQWLAKPENHDLWQTGAGGDPLSVIAALNGMEELVERSKPAANMTLPDAILHPRAVQWEPEGGSNLKKYTLSARAGRLSAELELLAPAPGGGFKEQKFDFNMAPSGQLRGAVLEKAKKKTNIEYRAGSGENFSGEVRSADLLFNRRRLEHRRPEQIEAGDIGSVYLKLAIAVDKKLPEGWTGKPPPAAAHFQSALLKAGKTTKWEDKVSVGLRVLSVDLGVRTFASCAVFELRESAAPNAFSFPVEIEGRTLRAVHERSFRLALPGEDADARAEIWREERADELYRLRRVLTRYRRIMRMTGCEAAQRPEALSGFEGMIGTGNNPFDFENDAIRALEGAKAAPPPVWDQTIADALKNYRKNLGPEVKAWRAQNRKREEGRHMGKSMWAIDHLTNTRKFLLSWSLLGRVTGDIRRQDLGKRGTFAAGLLAHIDHIKEDRLKTGADMIVQAARGYIRDKNGAWTQKYAPCEIVLFEDLSRYRTRTDRPRRENSQLMKWAHRGVRQETEMQGELYGLHTVDTSAAFSSRFHARLNTPGVRCRVMTKADLEKTYLRDILKKDGFDPAALRPGQIVPWDGGEMFACINGEGGLAVIHADINAAQNLQRRFWTRHADAFRVSCKFVREGEHKYWTPRSIGKRLEGAMGGAGVLVPADSGGELCSWRPESRQRYIKLGGGGGGGEDTGGDADSAAGDMEALAEDAVEFSGKYETFFRDPSGRVTAADIWCAGGQFWGRVKAVTLKALETSGRTAPGAAKSRKGG